MTVRTDIEILEYLSPRVSRVAITSAEVTMQDLHDTLRAWEDSPDGETYNVIIDSAGKEDLGGGVLVGITSTLQNAVVQFAARTVSVSGGTVTTTDATGESLIDSAATFITDGVTIGAALINFTDRSVATVLVIVSETEIICEPLDDGVSDQFTSGDVYKIWNIIQCNATGGNLTALDEFGATINAILPSFGTQIVLTAASSATLQEQADIRYSSFQNGVWVDVLNGVSGTVFPIGTPRQPVSNLTEAQSIADTVGLKIIYVLESLTITAGPTHEDMLFIGRSPKTTTITIDAAADVTDCEYQDALVTGTLDGKCYITACAVKDLLFISGHLERCVLREGTISLQGTGIGMFNRCSSVSATAAGVDIPEIDFNGSGQTLALQGFDGSIRLKNKTGSESVEINLAAGKVWLDADVTAGVFNIRGVGEVVDDSIGATVNTDGLLNPAVIADAVWDELLTGSTHNIQNSAGKALRGLGNLVVHTDTAQGPGTGPNQIQLAAAAAAVDGSYDPSLIAIVDGTGAGQSRLILQYDGGTRTATVDRDWKVSPDATSEYVVYADAGREHVNEGLAQAGTSGTITLNALASSVDDVYLHQTVFIRSGTGEDQVGIVIAYDGTTKVATIDGSWAVTPDSTSGYVMLPSHDNVGTEQAIAYGGEVIIDGISGSAGTEFPVGTRGTPSSNLTDALAILADRNLTTLVVIGTLVVGASAVLDNLTIQGDNELSSIVVLTSGCSTKRTRFVHMILTGELGGGVFCEQMGLTSVSGIGSDDDPSLFLDCLFLESTITMRAGLSTPEKMQFINCNAGVASGSGAILDMNGTTTQLALRKLSGKLTIINKTDSATTLVEYTAGELIVASSCTGGTIAAIGIGSVTDNSGGTTVIAVDMVTNASAAGAVWDETLSDHTVAGSTGQLFAKIVSIVKALLGLV